MSVLGLLAIIAPLLVGATASGSLLSRRGFTSGLDRGMLSPCTIPQMVFAILVYQGLLTEVQVTRALVVYKKSYYEIYGYSQRQGRFAARQGHRQAIVEAMRRSHEENQRTLEAVQAAFVAVGMAYDCLYRGELGSVAGYDLLLSVGGDGTFLELARYALDTPVLGVNSDPERSTAFFCAANRSSIRSHLEALLVGKLHEVRLARMQVTINNRLLPHYALNDLLIAHANPAAMTSYTLGLGTISEPQRSSGLWIATAAGSTAAIRAAGGRVLPLRSRATISGTRAVQRRRVPLPPVERHGGSGYGARSDLQNASWASVHGWSPPALFS